jgi:hypothetical protein
MFFAFPGMTLSVCHVSCLCLPILAAKEIFSSRGEAIF